MARIKLSEAERLKRKADRRARKKAARAEAKLARTGKTKKGKKSKEVKGDSTTAKNFVEVLLSDKTERAKMSKKVEDGKARNIGYNMGSLIYQLIK